MFSERLIEAAKADLKVVEDAYHQQKQSLLAIIQNVKSIDLGAIDDKDIGKDAVWYIGASRGKETAKKKKQKRTYPAHCTSGKCKAAHKGPRFSFRCEKHAS